MTTSTFLMLGLFLAAAVLLGLVAYFWAVNEEKIFKLKCTVSELEAENGQLTRLATSLKNISSHQDLMIKSYARGWYRTDAPDLLASRLHSSLKKGHLTPVEEEETRPVPVPV